MDVVAELEVAEAGGRIDRVDGEGDEGVPGGGDGEGLRQLPRVGLPVVDQRVGRGDGDDGPGILRAGQRGRQGAGGGGVPLLGLGLDLVGREEREDAAGLVELVLVREDEDPLLRDDGLGAADGLLQQRRFAEEGDEVLRLVLPADRPETLASSPGEDADVEAVVHRREGAILGRGRR